MPQRHAYRDNLLRILQQGGHCEPKGEAQKKPRLPKPWFWTSLLQNYEATISGVEATHLQLPANKYPLSALNSKGVFQVTQHICLDTTEVRKWLLFSLSPSSATVWSTFPRHALEPQTRAAATAQDPTGTGVAAMGVVYCFLELWQCWAGGGIWSGRGTAPSME